MAYFSKSRTSSSVATSDALRFSALIGVFALGLLLLGSIIFYKERMLMADAPWVVYNIINTHSLFIQEHRYGAFITQMFPLAGSLLHLPLQWILVLYSASFNLFYFISGLALYRKGQYKFTLLLALYCTVCVSDSYFWTNNEVHQGVCWCMLLCGYWRYPEAQAWGKYTSWLLFTLLAALAIFSHPIIIVVTVYIFGFYLLARNQFDKRRRIVLIIIPAIIAVKYYLSKSGWYDEGKISTLESISFSQVKGVLHTSTARIFLNNCLGRYWAFSLLTLLSAGTLLYARKFLQLLWMLTFFTVYFIAVCTVYPNCDFPFYIESEWMCISIIAALPFVAYGLPGWRKEAAAVLSASFFLSAVIIIPLSAKPFQERIALLEKMMDYFRSREWYKVVILTDEHNFNNKLEQKLIMSWGMPAEMLILSRTDHPQQAGVTAVCLSQKAFHSSYTRTDEETFINTFYAEKREP
ncbi:MAG: hypothetical protein QM743_01470 [Chitinophagaceae bacterium]